MPRTLEHGWDDAVRIKTPTQDCVCPCLPLDEAAQSRACDTQFHTGDVWKAVLCLKHHRPELDIFTIATPWTGLTVVAGLDPASVVLNDRFEEAFAHFMNTPFASVADTLVTKLDVVANNRSVVEARLKARGVIE